MKNEKVSGWKKSTLAAFIVVGIISFLTGGAGRREAAPTQKKEDTDTSYAYNLESEVENLMFKECQVACMSGKGYGIDYICWNDFLVVTDTVYKRVNGEYWKEKMSVEEMLQNLFGFWNYDTKQYKNYLITLDNDRLNFYIYDMELQKLFIYPGAVKQSIGFLWQVRDGQIYYRSNGAIYCMNILNGENRMVYQYYNANESDIPLMAGDFTFRSTCYGKWLITERITTEKVTKDKMLKNDSHIGQIVTVKGEGFASCRVFGRSEKRIDEIAVQIGLSSENKYLICYEFQEDFFWDQMICVDDMTAVLVKENNLFLVKRISDPAEDYIYDEIG